MSQISKLKPNTPYVNAERLDRLIIPCTVSDPKGLKFWEIQPEIDRLNQHISRNNPQAAKLTVICPELADVLLDNPAHLIRMFSDPVFSNPLVVFPVNAAVAYGRAEDKIAPSFMRFTLQDERFLEIAISAVGMMAVEAMAFRQGTSDGSLLEGRNAYIIPSFFNGYAQESGSENSLIIRLSARTGESGLGYTSPAELIHIPSTSGWHKSGEGSIYHLLVQCDASDPRAIGYMRADGPAFSPVVRRAALLGNDSRMNFINWDPDQSFYTIFLEAPKAVCDAERAFAAQQKG